MSRYKLCIEYDGSAFCGWQAQRGQPSVQQSLSNAVEGFCSVATIVYGAGRTDAGVHALGQVAHIDLPDIWPAATICNAVNYHLGSHPVAVLHVERVDAGFDARFSAISRHYLYRVIQRPAPLVLECGRAWRIPVPLDVERMRCAARCLVGHHDFTTFRAAACQAKSPIKTLDRLDISQRDDRIDFHFSARSFMHKQVRSIVGVLKLVGEGKWSVEDVERALAARDRTACGPVAPAAGLYLARVDYPAPWNTGSLEGPEK